MANESFSFEEAIGLTQKNQPSGAADPGGFSFEEALGKPAQAGPGFIPTIKRTGGQMLPAAATAAEDAGAVDGMRYRAQERAEVRRTSCQWARWPQHQGR